jgi:Kef-type K+ transport system membrane component KefB
MGLSHADIMHFFLALGIILIASRVGAEIMRWLKLPIVLGEIWVGILLGPTILGNFFPSLFETWFPFVSSPDKHIGLAFAMDGMVEISVAMLLFIAGLEVQLPIVVKQGRVALSTTVLGMLIPMGVGYLMVLYLPGIFSPQAGHEPWLMGLFVGLIMAVTALPVIAKILLDMGLFKTPTGMTIIASAMLIDILSWLVFSVVLTFLDKGSQEGFSFGETAGIIILFMVVMLTVGSRLINKSLPWVQTRLAWPGGILAFGLGFAFLASSFTEFIGIHAILGAFIVGIAIGDSPNLRERTKEILESFISNIFSPIFFVSIGLYVDFTSHFSFSLTALLLAGGFGSKLLGAYLGARWGKTPHRNALAIGFAMTTHGTLEIILGTLALNAGLISQTMYVAVISMVVISIIFAGPLLKPFVQRP